MSITFVKPPVSLRSTDGSYWTIVSVSGDEAFIMRTPEGTFMASLSVIRWLVRENGTKLTSDQAKILGLQEIAHD